MAEQIPYGVAESIINRLASSVFAEIGRIYGAMDELAELKDTTESIYARLLDAEEKQEQEQSHVVKNWIIKLKKVLHDADDLFDDFVIEDLRDKVDGHGKIARKMRNFFSCSNPIVFRSKMAHKIEAILKKFNDVAKDMSNLSFHHRDRVFNQNESEWRETSSFVLESEVSGREETKMEIIKLLMQTHSNQNVSLITVVGIGGLGKTALAPLAYNDAEGREFFSKQMWVCVSKDFEVKTLVKKILKSLNDNPVKMNKATLTQEANPKPFLVTNHSLHSCSFTPLSKLRYLLIGNVDPIGIKELPEEWMQNLIALEHLSIQLQVPLFRSMHHLLAALQQLTIYFITNNDVYEAYKIEEVTTQGQSLHCLCSLQQIQVYGWSYMRELLEWSWNIPSLQHMTISTCWSLESLPEGMSYLTNFQTLNFLSANSNLYARCQRGIGADWPKIAHIPVVFTVSQVLLDHFLHRSVIVNVEKTF